MASNWEQLQLLKRNAVRVKFAHLNPAVQQLIGITNSSTAFHEGKYKIPIRGVRTSRAMLDGILPMPLADGALSLLRGKPIDSFTFMAAAGVIGIRTMMAKVIQYTHDDLTEEMKDHGVLQIRFEKDYPPGWINPTSVMETHPIFSVTQNGDIIFRRVTPKEFKLLRIQQGWRGKTGLNISADPRALIFRWRGTLRKPLAPEVESAKLKDRIKALASRLKPIRLPKPQHAFLPARKPLLRMRRGR